MPKCSFVDLPDELIINVLRNLDHVQLLSCSLICRKFRSIFLSSVELRYHVELAVDGLSDCASDSLPYNERLQSILDRRKAWANLEFKKIVPVNLPGESRAYELVDGVFAKLTDEKSFCAAYLPSLHSDVKGRITSELKFPARDFAMDPSQDLIVFLEDDKRPPTYRGLRKVNLHVYSLSKHIPHPLAKSPIITFEILRSEIGNWILTGFLQIADDVLVLHYNTEDEASHIYLWEWTTGNLWLSQTFENYMDFAFISPRAYFLTSMEFSGSLHVYSLHFDDSIFKNCPKSSLVAVLLLPSLRPLAWIDYIGTHTSPIVAHPAPEKVAAPALKSYIHVVSIGYNSGQDRNPLSLFVPNYVLLAYAASRETPVVQWGQWGPKNTRLFEHPSASSWLRYVHGYRVVGAPQTSSRNKSFKNFRTICLVYDFNPYSGKVDASTDRDNESRDLSLHEEHTIVSLDIFQDAVTTSLPYRASVFPLKERYTAFFIDDERIMALKHDPSFENDFDDVDVLIF
ncbi:hypothetical protein ONZ45_g681 [Pleurotus djamor]|nr:hypothetical protein ONZ45_g19563 [Pleurotus djamor]KAJ8522794.1 hypothetical protein ONZ45_g681 [Pleurotus djamor]